MSKIDKIKGTFQQPLRTGITGGIGSGKTTVCRIFEALGIPVYYADDRAKALMTDNPVVKAKIISLFGGQAYTSDGSLNRKLIASIVFNDKDKLNQLNSIVHPSVLLDGEEWHKKQTGVPYTLKEAALLFESESHKSLDKVIVVSAPEELRISRVMQRDSVNKEEVEARMNKQLPDEVKLKLADFVIINDGKRSLIQQVWQTHRLLLKEASLAHI